jgi:hypothetical protein
LPLLRGIPLLALVLVEPRTSLKIAVGLLQSLALCALLLPVQVILREDGGRRREEVDLRILIQGVDTY